MRTLVILLILLPIPGQASINVVTSIEPLYLITKSIMQGVAEPGLLIKPQVSIHDFAFRPSQMRQLKQADLVIWIDRNFESGFQQLPEILKRETDTIELRRVLDLNQRDGHIWYSPSLLLQIIDRIQSKLSHIDPLNTVSYSHNAAQLSQVIEVWGNNTRKQLATGKPAYLLDHDFFSHFEKDMGIKAIAVLHDSNEQPPTIRELRRIESNLTRVPAKCLLYNEANPSRHAQNIAQKFGLPIYDIDPNTADFMQNLEHISATLLKCR